MFYNSTTLAVLLKFTKSTLLRWIVVAYHVVLCKYSKFRFESNQVVTSVFDLILNEHNYSEFSN